MKSIGIIAEYNPFHNGHLYHINKIKEKYPDYSIVLVMTGNFTERGDVSIIDKWKRTEIALKHGIDLVIELPYPFATQSADYFAYGAITILEKMGCEKVIFGSESDNVDDLYLIANTQIDNPEFERLVKIYSKMGNNYPTALSLALKDLTNKKIDEPNDLLGISYIKTILKNNYKIKYETIKRTNSYHDLELNEEISSATSIREALSNNLDISKQIPKDTISYYTDLHFIEDYFDILKYKIMTEKDLSIYHTVEEGIDKLLNKKINEANSYSELISLIKSKRYTYNKITRMLLHILCNFTKEKANMFKDISYIRILGFNDTGKKYLSSIKKNIDIPIISKITRDKDDMLEFELETTNIYNLKNKSIKKEEESIIYLGGLNDKE
ncbi:MAG: nucleotidyltransferase [Bacilli bacterium]|nr:nucleotidyltransferase [Bacilli bacterium]